MFGKSCFLVEAAKNAVGSALHTVVAAVTAATNFLRFILPKGLIMAAFQKAEVYKDGFSAGLKSSSFPPGTPLCRRHKPQLLRWTR